MSWREATAVGVLMNTRGLVELVILNIGLDLGILSQALFSIMVLMALVTTFMTSPLLSLIYPERLARMKTPT
jgi:Kef-type K+ transport system membrane component KefB